MTWSIRQPTPQEYEAIYFFALPVDNEILYHTDVTMFPMRYAGDLRSFILNHTPNAPLIPLDFHNAFCLKWLQPYELVRNMPYVDDTVRAAISLTIDHDKENN